MAGGLYGDIELGRSRGNSAVCPPSFIKPNLLCYVSGNCINTVDITRIDEINGISNEKNGLSNESESAGDALQPGSLAFKLEGVTQPKTHPKIIVADTQITTFAVYLREGIIAYVEKGSTIPKLCKYVQAGVNVSNICTLPAAANDLSIQSMCFSADGQYLAALGDLPSYHVTVWSWRDRKLLANGPNECPATHISFDPLDSKKLCTSGSQGIVKFWKLSVGFKKFLLHPTIGAEAPTCFLMGEEAPFATSYQPKSQTINEPNQLPRATPARHIWTPGHTIYCSSENGTEIYKYNTDNGSCDVVISTQSESSSLENTTHTDSIDKTRLPSGSFKCIAMNKQGFIVGGENGFIYILDANGNTLESINATNGKLISELILSPECKTAIVQSNDSCIYYVDLLTKTKVLVMQSDTNSITGIGAFILSNKSVTISDDGVMRFWDTEKLVLLRQFSTQSHPSCIGVSPTSYLIGVGSSTGHVRIYEADAANDFLPKLVFRKKIHKSAVKKILFENGGRYMMSAAADGQIYIYNVFETFNVIGYVSTNGEFSGATWHYEELEDRPAFLRLYVLAFESSIKSTLIYRFEFPIDQNLVESKDEGWKISKLLYQQTIYKTVGHIIDIAILPSHISAGKEIFYLVSTDRKLKMITAPTSVSTSSDKIILGNPSFEYQDHQLSPVQLIQSNTREWLLTWAPDGLITIRSLLEPERSLKIYAHDPYQNGVQTASFSRDCRFILTAGGDGILRKFDWKYNSGGRRVALAASENAETLAEAHQAHSTNITKKVSTLLENTPVHDKDDNAEEISLAETQDIQTNAEANQVQLENRAKSIREKLIRVMEKNSQAPPMEQIDQEEFIVDFNERDRLINEADIQIKNIRKEIEDENLTKQVICNRLKKEFWDSMETVGQCIQSFSSEPITNCLTEVPNYPIRKRESHELQWVGQIKRIRRVQMTVNNATKKTNHEENDADETTPHAEETENKLLIKASRETTALLYDPFELNTKERRRIQSVLLGECILDIKAEFNRRFDIMFKQKQDEIIKIEEKNERIAEILLQLQLEETVFHPELSNDEQPQRVIEVQDSEVKVQKFVNTEEQKRIEEKRRQDEERQSTMVQITAFFDLLRNTFIRAEQNEKTELIKPEWMNKSKEDMTDDERKQLKEFEKKMAVFKEEQEKYKKALETELRKLQSLISEILESFDTQLRAFYRLKLNTDQTIYQHELRMIKLVQASLQSDDDEPKEKRIYQRLEQLKQEKVTCTNEIPEIKKELEKYREEYESALKRDKDIERLFKKELHGHDFYNDALMRLFKRRNWTASENDDTTKQLDENLNLFTEYERESGLIDLDVPPLNQEVDMPDGLSNEMWLKLVEFRDNKIAVEKDVYMSGRKFNEMQTLVEVVQAPVLTDYSDAILIHRNVVEKLNDAIVTLGKVKVEALKEMKDYRKGIHALEWENKLSDLQAEDLIIRTRDIQLLRVTKQMQEYIRSGDEHKQISEILALEKRAEYSQKAHLHKIDEKVKVANKLDQKLCAKVNENASMKSLLQELEDSVNECQSIYEVKLQKMNHSSKPNPLREIYTRRRLVDLAKSQAQDITILREEVERLRLRTYPAFQS
ncbi:hypothetical protein BATDEDRAFT_34015 [Batrachochytrium dendrobatidis JAM81]|uniref:Cilia- and flagella-associated protein 43 n=1 Tax=Batrachochytrium dendrobatidis (strain JAM81 / FGSC 10211) TaxID=684364 RepID=F4NU06_BATDJ|nr:uncharacterized protein BATDEDRAFT_34015 [Batrachochytrium dendrobatidis JAM81]EGF83145.1 hypothetical protein BATDEDRAFT_34015 [Batrachochytrium dendrobatidis JAM81]|eukprot:XP_006675725.1 hypothetical protein BATDEDRAFT_34015 [Batrachochytrium dendrobatidis JAM81]